MHRVLLSVALLSILGGMSGCGQDKPVRSGPKFGLEPQGPHHDYSLTWVYAVGEVDAPSANDCKKALQFVEAESDCVGAACKYANDLVMDFEFACKKRSTSDELQRVKALNVTLAARASQSPTECTRQIHEWLSQGCGADGACAPVVQQWATNCAEQTQSPLARHLLERLVENSFQESRRVKLDVRSCADLGKELGAAAECNKPFDCEDALPRVDVYLERCANGQRKALPLAQAALISHIRLVAAKPVSPLALTDTKSKMVSLPGALNLAEGIGAMVRVCGEAVTDLPSYLAQRKACDKGEIELLTLVKGAEGARLELQKRWHESDASFSAAHPKLLVEGEADARGQQAIEGFTSTFGALPVRAADDFEKAFEQTNEAYAALPPRLRQSERLYQALAAHDAALVTMFGLIGEQKVAVAKKGLRDSDLLGLFHRANRYVFSDITRGGSVDPGKSSELSELALEQVLPKAFSAYRANIKKLNAMIAKRHIKPTVDPTSIEAERADYTKACSVASDRIHAAHEKLESCFISADACSADERHQRASMVRDARNELGAARVREILFLAPLGKKVEPSTACNGW